MTNESVIASCDTKNANDKLVEHLKTRISDSTLWIDGTGPAGHVLIAMLRQQKVPFNVLRLADCKTLRELKS